MNLLITFGICFVVVTTLFYFARHVLGGLVGLYRIVPVNEAHIRILQNKKEVFSSRTGKSAYWVIPFITKLHKLPLCNLAIPVSDVKLNDSNMAKFICDLVCFININNLDLAVERLTLTDASHEIGFDLQKLSEDLRAIMESIGRTVAAKYPILELYMNRQALDNAISKEVEDVFPRWGIELVDLELKDIKDAPGSTIIADIESKAAAEIRRDAEIKVAQSLQEAEVKKAESEEIFRKRQIEKDLAIGTAEQDKNTAIALQQAKANAQSIKAKSELEVGQAEIDKQKIQKESEAQKIKFSIEAEGQALQIRSVGQADADMIKAKKVADAEGTEKLAEALAKFNDAALSVKTLDIQKDVLIAKFQAFSTALSKADIKWVLTGDNAKDFFGLKLNGEGGAMLNQFLEETGIDMTNVKEALKQLTDKVVPKTDK